MNHFYYKKPLLLLTACWITLLGLTQPKLDFELKKPKQYEERLLGSEKNADKNFTIIRRFFQNTYTHYNYYYNANLLINNIIDQAKTGHKDDFTQLLAYYPWSLESTAQSSEIDSILYKCTSGILLHDLRNDWIDNMYLLMGKAYYLRRDFDSAAMAFQFLNYSFAPKDKEGNDKTIGSNAAEGSNAFTILSKEKKAYVLSRPPSRNDGFIWQARNLTDKGNYLDASSLIAILKTDPHFPKRLQPQLDEIIGYLYYKTETWDSAAAYLEKSMSMADNPSDRARRWFLAGQLYQMANDFDKAARSFAKCQSLATDPIMDVYARLSAIRLRKSDNPGIIDENIADLVAMAKKDKYTDYRDIIYYAAALIELERNGFEPAAILLEKSISNSLNNEKQKTLSQLALGDTRFQQKKYGRAAGPYDSLNAGLLTEPDAQRVSARKPGCLDVFAAEYVINMQDSLLRLADMPEEERAAMVRKLSNALRKKMGLQDEAINLGGNSAANLKGEASSLFTPASGTWYFYENNIRANGFNAFKEKWGARPNQDNWRRSASLNLNAPRLPEKSRTGDPDGMPTAIEEIEAVYDSTDVSYDNLYSRIPLSPEKRKKAEDQLIDALYKKAAALHIKIEDYPEAIKVYEEILRRQKDGDIVGKTLFNLIHCYTKTGDVQKAALTRARWEKEYGATAQTAGNTPDADKKSTAAEDATYEKVYGLFLEGRFAEALQARKNADSLLGNSYWKPQLLYLQGIYHIQQREDSLAIDELRNIVTMFSEHPLGQKAESMINVLRRRKEIEDYLTKLEVTRAEEDRYDPALERPTAPVIAVLPQKEVRDSARDAQALKAQQERLAQQKAEFEKAAESARLQQEAETARKLEEERIAAEKAAAEKAEQERIAAEQALAEKQRLEKEKADRELAEKLAAEKLAAEKELAEKQRLEKEKAEKELAEKQAKEREAMEKETANKAEAERLLKEKQAREKEELEKQLAEKLAADKLKAEKELAEKLAREKEAADKALADKLAREKAEADKLAQAKAEAEKQAAAKARAEREAAEKALLARKNSVDGVPVGKPSTASPFSINAAEPQVVAIVLEKIDPAYVNEVSYTLTNSRQRNLPGMEVEVLKKKIKDGLWLIELRSGAFENMQDAYDYIKHIAPITKNELITWLDASKYNFITISEANLAEVEKSGNIQLYLKVLREAVPGKF